MRRKIYYKLSLDRLKNIKTREMIAALYESQSRDGIKIVQRALNDMKKDIVVDGWMGNKTIKAIKSVNNAKLQPLIVARMMETVGIDEDSRVPEWIKIAKKEIGVREIVGGQHNSRVLEYHATTSGKYSTDEIPWCGSFVNWVMLQAGHTTTMKYPERAKAWRKFGTKIGGPVFGSIAIKNRRGGGHVGFVIGKSKGGKYLYILGGNQGNMVSVRRYERSVFDTFVVPEAYQRRDLAVYQGGAPTALSEA